MNISPIVFFAYNRYRHTKNSLISLRSNSLAKHSELFVYIDGPKNDNDKSENEKIFNFVKLLDGFRNIQIIRRENNIGLANSIVEGVTRACSEYGKVIVIEDDLIVSKYFLDFMNTALSYHENSEHVMHISGYMFPVDIDIKIQSFFLPFITSWGWGTWEHAWKKYEFNEDNYQILHKNRKARKRFNLDNSYNYWHLLKQKKNNKVDSWAIVWYLSVFFNKGLTLFPRETLVHNAGFDGSGTHCRASSFGANRRKLSQKQLSVKANYQVDNVIFNAVKKYLKSHSSKLTMLFQQFFP